MASKKTNRLNNIPMEKRGDLHLFVKGGKSPNPSGRPKGQKNYLTLYREALEKIGRLNGKEPNELELEIVMSGISKARKGDYRFYKDTLDRVHGPVTIKVDSDVNVTSEINTKDPRAVEIAKKYEDELKNEL